MEERVVRSGKPEVDDVVVVRMNDVTNIGVIPQAALVSNLRPFN
jgi:translation initiation factor 2 alpha subunit (eIF-2alpha)